MTLDNRVKSTLAGGGTVLGTWVHFVRSPSIVRMIAAAGFDFVCIDLQHSSFSWETVGDMCDMARASELVPFVRTAGLSGAVLNRIQDLGAMAVILPDIRAPSQLTELQPWLRYPPTGRRSATSSSAHTDYAAGSLSQLQRSSENNFLVVPQIESREGVAAVDALLATGVPDLIDIGRGDLASELGTGGDTRHPAVLTAVDQVIAAAARNGIPVSTTYTNPEDASDMMRRGVRCLLYASDRRILHSAYSDATRQFRRLLGEES